MAKSTKMGPKRASSVGIKELKDKASAIVESVQRTRRPVLITKNNRTVARIVPIGGEEGASDTRSLQQRLLDSGMLVSTARASIKDIVFEGEPMDASIAIASIIADREEKD